MYSNTNSIPTRPPSSSCRSRPISRRSFARFLLVDRSNDCHTVGNLSNNIHLFIFFYDGQKIDKLVWSLILIDVRPVILLPPLSVLFLL